MTVIVWKADNEGCRKVFESDKAEEVETGLLVSGVPYIQVIVGNEYYAWQNTHEAEYGLRVKLS